MQREVRVWWRDVAAIVVVALAAGVLAGCGGDDEQLSKEDVQAAAAAAVKKEREQQRLRGLEKQLRELKRERASGSSSASSSGGASGIAESCGDGVSVGPNTSCPFALNVATSYRATGDTVINAYSPARDSTFSMTCTPGSPTVCRGGDDASVYIN